MRLALLSSAAVIGLMAVVSPASAGPEMTGVGQIFVGAATTDSFFAGKSLDDPFSYGAKAKGYWPLSPDVHLQVDLFAEQNDDVTRSDVWPETDSTTIGAAAHLLHPFDKRARFGVAGSIWSNEVFTLTGDGQTDVSYGLVAVEGQFFGEEWTLTGQAGVFTGFSCDGGGETCFGTLEDGTFIRGKARYFLNDNTAFSAEVTQMWGRLDDDDLFSGKSLSVATSIWTLEAEHKFHESPFSGFIALSHERTEADIFSNADTNTVLLGMKFYLDQPTLRSNDQTGAELDTPLFGNTPEIAAPLVASSL